jgi:uncharacterized coiled-coil protein SlyX
MNERTVQRVEQWPSRGFSGGYATLRELADDSFSGAVRAAGAYLFMLNGRVIGVFDGRMDAFADADGTVFDAPSPAPVLVFAMLETGGDQRGRYYTEDTPLTEVDDMLSGGNFSGFVELSENVLSGDYYVAYYGGKSMSAAFVGASEDLVAGDEAFERAADEVGIFEVTEVDLDVQDVPEQAGDADDSDDAAAATGAGAAGTAAAGESADDEPSPESAIENAEAESASSSDHEASAAGHAEPDAAQPEPSPERSDADAEPPTADAEPVETEPAETEPAAERTETDTGPTAERQEADADSAAKRADAGSGATGGESAERAAGEHAPDAASEPAEAPAGEDVFSEEAEWRETNTVPALDPDESEPPGSSGDSSGGGSAGASASGSATAAKRERDAPTKGRSNSGASTPSNANTSSTTGSASPNESSSDRAKRSEAARERVEQLEAAVAERDARIDDLESELASAQSERDDLREERDRLESELESVRGELAGARERAERAGAGDGEHALSPTDALGGTNLFVRYDSKGEPTLDAVADDAAADEVNANLRVEHHTTFDADAATVDGEPYDAFLQGTLEHAFVSWLVRQLPYEIRDAGHQSGLSDLYSVIPEIDRAELGGVVEVEGDEGSKSHAFDVVCRDKRGQPLVVAELNANREPVVEERMTGLVESATAVARSLDGLGAGFFVTESFFKPDALSAATQASEGGLLSRDKRKSFVKVGRKTGYHLCLVEARDGSFHVSIPEL